MTDQTRLNEIRARVEAATPGPWKEIWPCNCEDISISRDGARNHEELHMTPPDAAFIAHARQDIPDLLAEVERLSAERDAARKRADERCEFDYKDGYEDGRAESDSTLLETVARLRAVIEEARAVVTDADETPEMIRLFLILDRGLKGAGG